MPTYAVNPNLIGLVLTDVPLRYESPVGPPMEIRLTYNQKDTDQPAAFSYSNLGDGWTMNWIEYVQDNPSSPAADVSVYLPDGQARAYAGYNSSTGAFAPDAQEGIRLVRVSTNPVRYERRFPDGAVETFSQSDGTLSGPRRIFLTSRSDPGGQAMTVSYDSSGLISAVVDTLGRSTSFLYGDPGSPRRVTRVTDPFGRRASFTYDASGRLSSISDAIGMTSTVGYATGSRIDTLTTPYGTTTFTYTENGYNYVMVVKDPLNQTSRYEFRQSAPGIPFSETAVPSGLSTFNSYINGRNTFYWDAQLMIDAPGDYTKARIFHWEHKNLGGFSNTTSEALESIKYPLENRIWNNYPGGQGGMSGTLNKPAQTARLLPDGSTQLTTNTYNDFAKPLRTVGPDGLVTTYTYAANGIDVTSVRYQATNGYDAAETSVWNSQHLPLSRTDAEGHTSGYTYNAAGQILSIRDAVGNTTNWTYDAQGFPISKHDRNGNVTTYTHDSIGRVASITDAAGVRKTYTYDPLDRPIRITYWDGTYEEDTYDKLDRVAHRDRAGGITRYGYDAVRNLVSVTDPVGATTRYAWYANNTLKSRTEPAGEVTQWVRDIEGRVVRRIDPNGATTSFTYDQSNRVASVADGLGHTTSFVAYDAMNRLMRSKDPNGVVTDYTYHPRGWPESTIVRAEASGAASGGDAVTRVAYDRIGKVTSSTDPDNVRIDYTYDAQGRLVRVTEASGGSVAYTLDAEGNRIRELTTRSDGATVVRRKDRTFNALNLVATRSDAQARATQIQYDGDRNEAWVFDPLQNRTERTFDVLGRVTSVRKFDASRLSSIPEDATFTWDSASNLMAFSDPAHVSTIFERDPSGRPIRETNPDAGPGVASYDTGGHLATVTDGRGITRRMTYDALDRVISAQSTDPSMAETFVWDVSDASCAGSFPVGHLTRAMDGNTVTSFCYDARGNVVKKTEVVRGGEPLVTQYSYTLADRLATTALPSGAVLTYTRSVDGRVRDVSVSVAGIPAQSVVSGARYLPFGPLEHYQLGTNQTVDRTYDANYWLLTLASPAISVAIDRDALGRPISIRQSLSGGATTADKLGFDGLSRVLGAAAGHDVQSFVYATGGDRTSKTGVGSGAGAYLYDPGSHRLRSVGGRARSYDGQGNLVGLASTSGNLAFGYDQRNRLALVSRDGADIATYTYNPLGQRVYKTVMSPQPDERQFVYDSSNRLIGEYGATRREYVWMDGVLVGILDGEDTSTLLRFVHADEMGSPRAVTDGAGTLLWSWSYTQNPFGESDPVSTAYNLELRYPGQYHDAETGLHNNGQREYEPATGRYTQADPLGMRGGVNPYTYVYSNPFMLMDPTGLSPDCQRMVWWRGDRTKNLVGSKVVDTNWDLVARDIDDPASILPRDPRKLRSPSMRAWASELKERINEPMFGVDCVATKFETIEDTYDVYQNVKYVDYCVEDMGCGVRASFYIDAGTAREPQGYETDTHVDPADTQRHQERTFLPAVIVCAEWMKSIQ